MLQVGTTTPKNTTHNRVEQRRERNTIICFTCLADTSMPTGEINEENFIKVEQGMTMV